MKNRNIIIASLITILIVLIIAAAFAPVINAPIVRQVSPLVLQSPLDVTLTTMSNIPVLMREHDPLTLTPTTRPTLPAPTDTPTPTNTPTLRPTLP